MTNRIRGLIRRAEKDRQKDECLHELDWYIRRRVKQVGRKNIEEFINLFHESRALRFMISFVYRNNMYYFVSTLVDHVVSAILYMQGRENSVRAQKKLWSRPT